MISLWYIASKAVAMPTAVAVIAVEASVAAGLRSTCVFLAIHVDPVLQHLELVRVQAEAVCTVMRTNGLTIEDW